MAEAENLRVVLRKIVPRVFRAAFLGLIEYFLIYVIPSSILSGILPATVLKDVEPLLSAFATILVFFTVVAQLSAETILGHALSVAKALTLIAFLIYAFNGGVLTAEVMGIHILLDFRAYLGMLITVELLALARGVLQAISLLSEKVEQPAV